MAPNDKLSVGFRIATRRKALSVVSLRRMSVVESREWTQVRCAASLSLRTNHISIISSSNTTTETSVMFFLLDYYTFTSPRVHPDDSLN
jgi:hypothetical protein